ncbi:MAG: alpha/beta hydrolase [Gammaproteobacteria bacterium]|nr:alpha/beta hydrolase [Gammaproteobacteria bacterium]
MTLEDWQHGGEYFPHRAQRIFFKRSAIVASRPTLLLIHGFPTASWDWSSMWLGLSARFNLIAPDMLGYGLSAKPLGYAYSIFDQADLCESLLARLHVNKYHILSHDVGDTVAQELIARAMDGTAGAALQSACLLNGGLFPEAHRPRFMQRLLLSPLGNAIATRTTFARFAASMTNIFGANTPPSKRELEVMWSLITANDGLRVLPKLINYMRERRRNRLRWVGALVNARGSTLQPHIPVRLIIGADDPISGRHMAARYNQLVHDADVMLLNGIGHYPQIESPELVLRGYMDFSIAQRVNNKMSMLHIQAGKRAIQHIRAHGLRPQDISIIPGAAGGPKGLGLARLDEWLFADWLPQGFALRDTPIDLIGASIGAWRFASVCRGAHEGKFCANKTRATLQAFANAYTQQYYPRKVSSAYITQYARDLIHDLFSGHIHDVLTHPHYRLHVLAVRGKGILAREARGEPDPAAPPYPLTVFGFIVTAWMVPVLVFNNIFYKGSAQALTTSSAGRR